MTETIPPAPVGLVPADMLAAWRDMSSKIAVFERRQWELLGQIQAANEKIFQMQRVVTDLRDEIAWVKRQAK